jgi:hypothetical protein
MKVDTDIKAGNIISDSVTQLKDFGGQATAFVSDANRQAEKLTTTVVNKSTQLWNCLTNTFR